MKQILPTPQPPDVNAFIPVDSSRALGKYFQNVQFKFMQMDNFGLSLDDEGELKQAKKIFLRDLFVAPHLSSRHLDPEQVIRAELEDSEKQPQWLSITDVLKQQPFSFILGDPGTGKTTLIQWLMLAFSYSGNNLTKMALGELVPFALILRELPLSQVNSFKDLWKVFSQHNQALMNAFEQYPEADFDVVKRLLNSGQALILLDGLDEVTHVETRRRLGQAVLEGMQQYPKCRFVISSRVVGFDQIEFVFNGFSPVDVIKNTVDVLPEKLSNFAPTEGSGGFLKAAFDALKIPEYYLVPFHYQQAQQFVSNWYQQYHPQQDGNHQARVAELLARIQKNDGLGRLARIPVLLNMICFIHARRGRLPDGRAELYQRIAETYLVALDRARGLEQGSLKFDYLDRSEWLSTIALTMQESRSKYDTAILIAEEKVREILRQKLLELDEPQEQIEEEISFLLRHFAERSGLFIPRGEGLYGFSHLSFLEYFAAKALKLQAELGEIDWEDLRAKTQLIWWQETFVLLFEQLDNAKLVAKYLALLFPETKNKNLTFSELEKLLPQADEITVEQITSQVLLAAIVMDSGVKLTLSERQRIISELWQFYLQIPINTYYKSTKILANRLWQQDFSAIELGLAAMKEVSDLNLSDTEITDLSPLAELTQLQELNLSRTQISDLSPLAGLTQLQTLDLADTQVRDLSALARLTQLQSLDLMRTQVSDLSPLAELTQLEILFLDGTQVSDLSTLERLTKLWIFSLTETQVSDLSALARLTQLHYLDLTETQVRDLSPLAGLTQLQTLYLRKTHVNDLSPLAKLTQLEIIKD